MGGGTLAKRFKAVEHGAAETLIVLENDLYRRAERATVDGFLDRARQVVVLDHLHDETTREASSCFPPARSPNPMARWSATKDGRNASSRSSSPEGDIQESWRWLRDIARHGRPLAAAALDADGRRDRSLRRRHCRRSQRSRQAAPSRISASTGSKIRREPHRYSGRTAIHAARQGA